MVACAVLPISDRARYPIAPPIAPTSAARVASRRRGKAGGLRGFGGRTSFDAFQGCETRIIPLTDTVTATKCDSDGRTLPKQPEAKAAIKGARKLMTVASEIGRTESE